MWRQRVSDDSGHEGTRRGAADQDASPEARPAGPGWFRLNAGASNWLWLSLLVIVLDQVTKRWILNTLELFERIDVLPILDIIHLRNEGAAFSLLAQASGWQRWFFISVALVISMVILVWLRRLPARGQTLLASGLCLVLGGALGNVIDRVLYGSVVDFVYFNYERWYFPAFNVADAAITVGAGLLILDSVLEMRRARRTGSE
jgi:signal peptidase II